MFDALACRLRAYTTVYSASDMCVFGVSVCEMSREPNIWLGSAVTKMCDAALICMCAGCPPK